MEENIVKEISRFYENADLSVVPKIQFRGFTLRMNDGRVVKVRKKISSVARLRELLVTVAPVDVYVSVSQWVSPHLVQGKEMHYAGYKWMSNVLLSSDMVVDIDSSDYRFPKNTIEEAYAELIRVRDYFHGFGYNDFLFVRTGKGFHLWVLDWFGKNKKNVDDPFLRREYYWKKKVAVVEDMKRNYLITDNTVIVDMFRVVRVFGSLHRNGTVIYSTKDIDDDMLVNAPLVPFHEALCQETARLACHYRKIGGMMTGRHTNLKASGAA